MCAARSADRRRLGHRRPLHIRGVAAGRACHTAGPRGLGEALARGVGACWRVLVPLHRARGAGTRLGGKRVASAHAAHGARRRLAVGGRARHRHHARRPRVAGRERLQRWWWRRASAILRRLRIGRGGEGVGRRLLWLLLLLLLLRVVVRDGPPGGGLGQPAVVAKGLRWSDLGGRRRRHQLGRELLGRLARRRRGSRPAALRRV